jgi:hypothetical protein
MTLEKKEVAGYKRSERISLFFSHKEMREIEAMANQLDIAVRPTLRRIVLLALRRHRQEQEASNERARSNGADTARR